MGNRFPSGGGSTTAEAGTQTVVDVPDSGPPQSALPAAEQVEPLGDVVGVEAEAQPITEEKSGPESGATGDPVPGEAASAVLQKFDLDLEVSQTRGRRVTKMLDPGDGHGPRIYGADRILAAVFAVAQTTVDTFLQQYQLVCGSSLEGCLASSTGTEEAEERRVAITKLVRPDKAFRSQIIQSDPILVAFGSGAAVRYQLRVKGAGGDETDGQVNDILQPSWTIAYDRGFVYFGSTPPRGHDRWAQWVTSVKPKKGYCVGPEVCEAEDGQVWEDLSLENTPEKITARIETDQMTQETCAHAEWRHRGVPPLRWKDGYTLTKLEVKWCFLKDGKALIKPWKAEGFDFGFPDQEFLYSSKRSSRFRKFGELWGTDGDVYYRAVLKRASEVLEDFSVQYNSQKTATDLPRREEILPPPPGLPPPAPGLPPRSPPPLPALPSVASNSFLMTSDGDGMHMLGAGAADVYNGHQVKIAIVYFSCGTVVCVLVSWLLLKLFRRGRAAENEADEGFEEAESNEVEPLMEDAIP
ncbi:unnamed protein product [Amoebophrya sp. A25]|nr:unnamed protein product [Amoebophrya sp. A25]|eukprot:GSA25T00017189001.1